MAVTDWEHKCSAAGRRKTAISQVAHAERAMQTQALRARPHSAAESDAGSSQALLPAQPAKTMGKGEVQILALLAGSTRTL